MKNVEKKIALLLLFIVTSMNAQIGVGTKTPHPDAMLEVAATNKGILLPRVALTATTAVAPLSSHVAGMTVYNIATVGDVTPGYYYNDGSKWVKLATGLTAATPDATTTSTGKIQLAGDLSGTADAPTVPGLLLKANTTDVDASLALKAPLASPEFTGAPKAPTATVGDNSTLVATTAFVSEAVTAAATPDATITATGKIQLAGDLSGTAAAPSVANLAINTDKLADNAVTSAKIVDGTVATADLADGSITAAKLNTMSATTGHVLKFDGTVWAPAADAGLTATTVSNEITAGELTTTVNGVAATAVTLPVADGSETKINTGTNVTVTGAGTTLSPYVVNSEIETATQTPSTAITGSATQVAVASTNVQGALGDLATAVKTAGNNLYTSDGTLSGNRIVTQGSSTLAFTSSAANGFSVDGSTFSVNTLNNRIGIGTTTPASALNVVASGISNGDGIYLGTSDFPNIGYAQLRVVNGSAAEPVWPGGGVMELRASNNDAGAKIVAQGNSYVNNGGGSFGIGTTFPSERLTVNGGALISSLSGTGSRMVVASATGVLSTQAIQSASTSVVLNAGSFERAALTGDVTAAQNSNALTISNNAVTAEKLASMGASDGQVLKYNGSAWAPATISAPLLNISSPLVDNYTVQETDSVIYRNVTADSTITFPSTLPAGKVFYVVNISGTTRWTLSPSPLNQAITYVDSYAGVVVITVGNGQIITASSF